MLYLRDFWLVSALGVGRRSNARDLRSVVRHTERSIQNIALNGCYCDLCVLCLFGMATSRGRGGLASRWTGAALEERNPLALP